MTSFSRRKHPITQPSTRRQTPLSRLLHIGTASLALAFAGGPLLWAGPAHAEDAQPSAVQPLSPLERLRQRSADGRWKNLKESAAARRPARPAKPETAAPSTGTPAVTPPQAAPFRQTSSEIPISDSPSEAPVRENLLPEETLGGAEEAAFPSVEAEGADTAADLPRLPLDEDSPQDEPFAAGVEPEMEDDLPPDRSATRFQQPTPSVDVVAQARPLSPIQPYPEPVRDPRELRKLTTILPYPDYEPDAKTRETDRCLNLCPRPLGMDCPDCRRQANGVNDPGNCPECPEEVRLTGVPIGQRYFPQVCYNWEASNLYANPLYFEDFALERYGHTHHYLIQPPFSIGRTFFQLMFLPYQITIDPICKCVYPLGYYRPGNRVPPMYYQVPWNAKAAAVQAGVFTGGAFLFP